MRSLEDGEFEVGALGAGEVKMLSEERRVCWWGLEEAKTTAVAACSQSETSGI
jgi:hypothetical protein